MTKLTGVVYVGVIARSTAEQAEFTNWKQFSKWKVGLILKSMLNRGEYKLADQYVICSKTSDPSTLMKKEKNGKKFGIT